MSQFNFKITKMEEEIIDGLKIENYGNISNTNVTTFDFRDATTTEMSQFSSCAAAGGYIWEYSSSNSF